MIAAGEQQGRSRFRVFSLTRCFLAEQFLMWTDYFGCLLKHKEALGAANHAVNQFSSCMFDMR